MTEEQKNDIAAVLIKQKFIKGEVIVRQGDSASSFYFVKSGQINCIKEETKEVIKPLTAGNSLTNKKE